MQDDLTALFAYDRWANQKVLDACRNLAAEQYVAEPTPGWSSVRSTINHIALATAFNLRTLAGDAEVHIPTEAELVTVDDAAGLLDRAYHRFDELCPTLTPERLNSSYHRGQVASKLKRFGIEQPITDLFWWFEQVPQETEAAGGGIGRAR